MQLGNILTQDAIELDVSAQSKKQVLKTVARRAAQAFGLDERATFEHLSARERLGSTGFGSGIALPHCRTNAVDSCHAVLLTLSEPVDFEADDEGPVDIIFGLIAPETAEGDSLKCLAKTSRLLKDPSLADRIREAHSASEAFALMTDEPHTPLATAA